MQNLTLDPGALQFIRQNSSQSQARTKSSANDYATETLEIYGIQSPRIGIYRDLLDAIAGRVNEKMLEIDPLGGVWTIESEYNRPILPDARHRRAFDEISEGINKKRKKRAGGACNGQESAFEVARTPAMVRYVGELAETETEKGFKK